ncbi:MAG: hypothetical protein PVF96_01020 [Candidatus Bathyarchaeota archaeon]|jgi:hypothetical protein
MKKKPIITLLIVSMVIVLNFTTGNSKNSGLTCSACDNGVVEKKPGETFIVKINFRNSGSTKGVWSVNIAFESESWSWTGTPHILSLRSDCRKTLIWDGTIPNNIQIGSIARLVVYYNDSHQPLNWWIHVINGAELSISSSVVK